METILDSAQSESKTLAYAGFWIRFGAALIDGIIMWVIGAVISMLFFGEIFVTPEANGWAGYGVDFMVSVALNWLYFAGMESSARQATLGKSAVGVKVTDLNGERISFARATGRYFAKFISGIILGIGYIMAAFSEKKQALHDQIAATFVVMK